MQSSDKHRVEMVVTEVHEYNLTPLYQVAGPGGLGHHQMLASPGETSAPLICIHMQKTEKSPVEPDLPQEMRMVLKSIQQAGVGALGNLQHVTAQASIVLSPQEYDGMGRPRAHEKIVVTFEYEAQ